MLNGNIILEENNGKEKIYVPDAIFKKKRSGKTRILESGNVKNMVIEVL